MSSDGTSAHEALRDLAIGAGFLVPLGRPGLYARSAAFEQIVAGISSVIDELSTPLSPIRLTFPPVMATEVARKASVFDSFPNLMGLVLTQTGASTGHRGYQDPDRPFETTALVLPSSACHPLYPLLTGTLPAAGHYADVLGQCFRHEPSDDPARMLSFRQRELVYFGNPSAVERQYRTWVSSSTSLLLGLGLPATQAIGHDPFFGRAGRLLADLQTAKKLKTEINVDLHNGSDGTAPTAVASCNLHEDHFCKPFDVRTTDGAIANSACVGFGLERIALALLHVHGPAISEWPEIVQERLSL